VPNISRLGWTVAFVLLPLHLLRNRCRCALHGEIGRSLRYRAGVAENIKIPALLDAEYPVREPVARLLTKWLGSVFERNPGRAEESAAYTWPTYDYATNECYASYVGTSLCVCESTFSRWRPRILHLRLTRMLPRSVVCASMFRVKLIPPLSALEWCRELIYPDDGSSRFLYNVGTHLPDYMGSYYWKWSLSVVYLFICFLFKDDVNNSLCVAKSEWQ